MTIDTDFSTDRPDDGGLWQTVKRRFADGDKEINNAALMALLIKVGATGLGFLSQILLARLLGAAEYGVYSYYWIWLMVGGIITALGFMEASKRFIAEYRDTGAYGLAWGFIYRVPAIILGFSSAVALVGVGIAYLLTDYLPEGHLIILLLVLACLPIFALQDAVEGYALAFSWTGLGHVPPYILRQGFIIVFMLGLVAMSQPATAQTAFIAVFCSILLATAIQLSIFLWRASKKLPKAKPETDTKHWLKTSIPMVLAAAFQLCLSFIDIIILGFFVSSELIALYFAATRISTQVAAVQFSVTSAFSQRMSGLYATGKTEEFHALIHKAARWIFWPTLLIAVGVLIVGWPLLWLFGEEFTAAYWLLPILVAGLLARASTGGAEDALKMTGFEREEFKIKGFSTVINVLLNLALIPYYGIYGAAIATTLSLIVSAIWMEVSVRQKIGTSSFIGTLSKR